MASLPGAKGFPAKTDAKLSNGVDSKQGLSLVFGKVGALPDEKTRKVTGLKPFAQ
jgi:hypothetical protein